jgi:hypothetical protein
MSELEAAGPPVEALLDDLVELEPLDALPIGEEDEALLAGGADFAGALDAAGADDDPMLESFEAAAFLLARLLFVVVADESAAGVLEADDAAGAVESPLAGALLLFPIELDLEASVALVPALV